MKVSLPPSNLQLYWSIQKEITKLNNEVNDLEKKGKDFANNIHIVVKLSIAQSLKRVIDGVEE